MIQSPPPNRIRPCLSALACLLLALVAAGPSRASEATYHSFSNSNTVSRISGDGEVRYGFPLPAIGSFTQPSGLAVDPVAKKLYYCRINFIGSVNLDGSGNATVKDFGLGNAPLHLEIDVDSGHLYIYFNGSTEGMARGIYRMDTDGAGLTPIVTEATLAAIEPPIDPLVLPNGRDGLVIDVTGRVLYWSDARILYRATFAGLDPERLAVFPFNISSYEIDHSNAKLYYADSTRVERSALDGSGAEAVFTPGFGFPEALELDAARGRIYFIHDSRLKYTNLDGSLVPVEVVGIGGTRGKDIEVGPMPALTDPVITSVSQVKVSNSPNLRIWHTTDPGIRYYFEASPDMSAGSWVPIGASVIGDGELSFSNFPIDSARKFFRLLRDDPCE